MTDDGRPGYPDSPADPLDMDPDPIRDVPTVYNAGTTVLTPADPDTFIPRYPPGYGPQVLEVPDDVRQAAAVTTNETTAVVAERPVEQVHVVWESWVLERGAIVLPPSLGFDLNLNPGNRFVLKLGERD